MNQYLVYPCNGISKCKVVFAYTEHEARAIAADAWNVCITDVYSEKR